MSEYFDFFSAIFNINSLKAAINKLIKKNNINFDIWEEKEDTLICLIDNIKVSFFKYEYPLIRPLIKKGDLQLASIEDILAMKSIAVIQRGCKKDFFDIWYLIKKGYNLKKILKFAKNKFGKLFSQSIFLKALTYFEDADNEKGFDFDKIWYKIKGFFIKQVKDYFK